MSKNLGYQDDWGEAQKLIQDSTGEISNIVLWNRRQRCFLCFREGEGIQRAGGVVQLNLNESKKYISEGHTLFMFIFR